MKLVHVLKNIAKKSTFLRILMRNGMYSAKKVLYKLRGISVKVDEKLLIFGAYNGKNPYMIKS